MSWSSIARGQVRHLVLAAVRHPVARNAVALYAARAVNYVFPLILVPYLARVLKPSGYGMVLLAQSLAIWLTLIMEYGFVLSATREVARHRREREHLRDIVSSVLGAQLLLALTAACLTVASGFFVDAFRAEPGFAILAWLIAISQAFAPVWYFQGIELMTYPATVNVIAKGLATGATFLWVGRPEDAWKVLALQGMGGFVAMWILFGKMAREVRPSWPSAGKVKAALRMGWPLFFYRGAASLFTTANTFVLGVFVPPERVAFYAGPEKIAKAMLSTLEPFGQALYPRMTRLAAEDEVKAGRLGRAALGLVATLGMVLGFVTWAGASPFVRLFLGDDYAPAIPVLRVLAWVIPASALGNFLGIQWMLPYGMDRVFNTIIASSGVLNIALALVLAPTRGPLGMATAVVATEALIALSAFAVLWRRRAALLRLIHYRGRLT
ncbi:oligosaccharide flippase family protein [Carboxydochorda subterranea]|uniref:Oligosaccharide flippase family protein n=1 Tax=Carboxydichorda subterranea TaxID=3109565 RepID=A0ABZ1C1J4_9FIRM|nr:oligosaccharide flippase family protein [Limnochorda sp. L945t]WRP18842.1 oligosaccharide flippase family protein [Limnochorda sp. L945t]